MSIPSQLLALGILVIFGILVFLMIRASRREKIDQENQLIQLGFESLADAPPGLQRRVEDLYQSSGARDIKLWRIFHRRELDQDLYLFDAVDTRGENSQLGTEIFAVVSRELALPRFSLVTLPDFDRSSLIGNIMDKLLDKVMSYAEGQLQLERIELADQPLRDDQVLLFGRDSYAVRDMLDRVGLSYLRTEGLPIQIAGSGDFLTMDFSASSNLNQPGQDLVSRYQTFVQISRRFME